MREKPSSTIVKGNAIILTIKATKSNRLQSVKGAEGGQLVKQNREKMTMSEKGAVSGNADSTANDNSVENPLFFRNFA